MREIPNGLEQPEKTVFDMVARKEPIDLDGLMRQFSTLSRDEVHSSLQLLEREGHIEEREIEGSRGVVTNDKWCVADSEVGK